MQKISAISLAYRYVLEWILYATVSELKLHYICKPGIGKVCNAFEGHCLQTIEIVHHNVNGRFD